MFYPPLGLGWQLEDTKKNSEKLIDTLKAVLEETDIRIADLKKEAYEFKRDIVVGAENMRTGNTMAEKVRLCDWRRMRQLSPRSGTDRFYSSFYFENKKCTVMYRVTVIIGDSI